MKKLIALATILLAPELSAQCPPQLSYTLSTDTLTCFQPSVNLLASTTNTNAQISWTIPPGYFAGTTASFMPTGSIAFPPPYYTFTVMATNTISACSTVSVFNIYYNFKPPVSLPAIAAPGFICNESVMLTIGNSTVTSGVPGASVTSPCWQGPPPVTPTCGISGFSATTPGVYSLTVLDSYNGCMSTGTINVTSNQPLFSLQGTPPASSLSCDGSVTVIPEDPGGYSVSVTSGSINGNSIVNLCYGMLKACLTYTASGCRKCDSILINAVTGTVEMGLQNEIEIFPNPTRDVFRLQNTSSSSLLVRLIDISGREVRRITIDKETEITGLDNGVYYLGIKSKERWLIKKLIKLDN